MADRSVAVTDTLETFRTTFNDLALNDFGDKANLSASITATNLVDAMNETISIATSTAGWKIEDSSSTQQIIGGGEIYKLSIEIADRIELTRVHTSIEVDTSYPEINLEKWQEVKNEKRLKDEKNEYDFSFLRYDKIN